MSFEGKEELKVKRKMEKINREDHWGHKTALSSTYSEILCRYHNNL